MPSVRKLEKELKAAEGQLAFYDGLHEGTDKKARNDLKEAISVIQEKIEECQAAVQAEA